MSLAQGESVCLLTQLSTICVQEHRLATHAICKSVAQWLHGDCPRTPLQCRRCQSWTDMRQLCSDKHTSCTMTHQKHLRQSRLPFQLPLSSLLACRQLCCRTWHHLGEPSPRAWICSYCISCLPADSNATHSKSIIPYAQAASRYNFGAITRLYILTWCHRHVCMHKAYAEVQICCPGLCTIVIGAECRN